MSKIVLPTINEQIYQDNWSIDNSSLFRLALISDNKQVKQFCNQIANRYIEDNKSIKKQSKVAYWIKILCINLIFAQITQQSIAISRRKEDYCDGILENVPKSNKIHKIWLKYKQVIPILEWMIESEFIMQELGNHTKHLRTRIAPTIKFVDLLNKTIKIEEAFKTIKYDESIEELVLLTDIKDDIKELIPYKENFITKSTKNILLQYNQLINTNIISFKDLNQPTNIHTSTTTPIHIQGTFDDVKTDILQYSINDYSVFEYCILRRIFSRSSFENGGRYYAKSITGKTYQNISKEERKTILINGVKTVEIDYSSHHINILKDLNNIPRSDKDTYHAINKSEEILPRILVKKILLMGINSKSLNSLRLALQQDIKDNPKHYIGLESKWLTDLSSHINAVIECNKDIKQFIGSDQGIILQRIDSDITTLILEYFTSQGKICLPIHDSYIVEEQYEEELKAVMNEFYTEVIESRKEII